MGSGSFSGRGRTRVSRHKRTRSEGGIQDFDTNRQQTRPATTADPVVVTGVSRTAESVFHLSVLSCPVSVCGLQVSARDRPSMTSQTDSTQTSLPVHGTTNLSSPGHGSQVQVRWGSTTHWDPSGGGRPGVNVDILPRSSG